MPSPPRLVVERSSRRSPESPSISTGLGVLPATLRSLSRFDIPLGVY